MRSKFELTTIEEKQFYEDVKKILLEAREHAYSNAALIKNLSKELSDEFGSGFSVANLRNCRQAYLAFPQGSYGFSMLTKIPWSHLRTIMRRREEFLFK